MRKIFFALFFITICYGNVEVIQGSEVNPFPDLETLNNIILNRNREKLAEKAINDIYDADASCEEKYKYVNCFMGKLNAFIYVANKNYE